MPKPTFLNLPESKRNRITELALDEFSTHPYRQASLSRIVARAGIAKGSMYQYFENKLDLYRWLVTEELEQRKTQWLERDSEYSGPGTAEQGLFADIERLVMTQIGFMLAHPRLARLSASAMEPTADEDLRELHGALRRAHIGALTDRIEQARESGEIRADVDARTLAHLIDAMILRGTTNAVLDRLGIDVQKFLSEPHASVETSRWRELVRETLGLIRAGISVPFGASANMMTPATTHAEKACSLA